MLKVIFIRYFRSVNYFTLLTEILKNISMKPILKTIEIENTNNTWMEIKKAPVLSYQPKYSMCYNLDLHDFFDLNKNSTPSVVWLEFDKADASVSLNLEEKTMKMNRTLKNIKTKYSGPHITIPNLRKLRSIEIFVKFTQTINIENDENKPCQNYPTEEFKTFGHCDQDYLEKSLGRFGLNSFWSAKSLDDVTKLRYV